MSHPGGETPGLALPFETRPCDRRPLECVERVTLERHSAPARRQDNDYRLALHAPTVAPPDVTRVTISSHGPSNSGAAQ